MAKKMTRRIRRKGTSEENARHQKIQKQIEKEKPELIKTGLLITLKNSSNSRTKGD